MNIGIDTLAENILDYLSEEFPERKTNAEVARAAHRVKGRLADKAEKVRTQQTIYRLEAEGKVMRHRLSNVEARKPRVAWSYVPEPDAKARPPCALCGRS